MRRCTPKNPSTDTSRIGERVVHSVPSILYGQVGTITACAGTKYGQTYWLVEYINPTTQQRCQTAFNGQMLIRAV